MRLIALAGLLTLLTAVLGQSTSVDSYVASESPIARAGLLANIGPSGAKASGAKVRTALSNARQAAPAHRMRHTVA